MMLNHSSPIPLYHQLADILETRIRNGKYTPGHKIPSEPQLAEIFGIGRPTVRQAIELLVRKNILEKRKGSGTFVLDGPVEVNLLSMAGTTSAFLEKGQSIETRIIEPPTLIEVEPARDNPFSDSHSFYYSRLTLANRSPVLFETYFLHPEVFPDFDQVEIENQSLVWVVKDMYYLEPISYRQNFRVISIDIEKANWLDLAPDSPLLLINRYISFKNQAEAIYTQIYCRTDKFVYSQEYSRK